MMNDLPSLNKHFDISLPINAKQKARLLMIEEKKNPPSSHGPGLSIQSLLDIFPLPFRTVSTHPVVTL